MVERTLRSGGLRVPARRLPRRVGRVRVQRFDASRLQTLQVRRRRGVRLSLRRLCQMPSAARTKPKDLG